MVKIFTPNKNGKIEFTKDELEKLLNEVWYDGKNSNNNYFWTSPSPWYTTTCMPLNTLSTSSTASQVGVSVTLDDRGEQK